MQHQKNVIKYLLAATLTIFSLQKIQAQTGSFTAMFTPINSSIKPVAITFNKPLFKFENSHGYWFINPYNNYKHFNIQPDQGYADRKEETTTGIAFITFSQNDNDFDFYASNDSISISLQKNKCVINPPTYDPKIGDKNKPLHIHINNITAGDISFTISGTAALTYTSGYEESKLGTITGSGHFYREPKYAKSDVLPGCNCDPTIYAAVYDEETNLRTTSACEAALNHKLFDAVQKSMAPLFTNLTNHGNDKMEAGEINISMAAGHVNINVPINERPYCSSDYYHNGLTGIDAHKKYFTSDDRFGLHFIKMPANEEMGISTDAAANSKKQAAKMDSLYKLADAKKITMAQYSKAINEALTSMSSGAPDIKKLEAGNNLYLTVIINPDNKTETELKLADKNKTVVTHNIKGAAFEVFSPSIKDGDGGWIKSRSAIYFGKFTQPVMGKSGGGFDAETTNATYPINGNKLSVYNIIIKMEGGKDLMDKALANIDFDALQNLITKQ